MSLRGAAAIVGYSTDQESDGHNWNNLLTLWGLLEHGTVIVRWMRAITWLACVASIIVAILSELTTRRLAVDHPGNTEAIDQRTGPSLCEARSSRRRCRTDATRSHCHHEARHAATAEVLEISCPHPCCLRRERHGATAGPTAGTTALSHHERHGLADGSGAHARPAIRRRRTRHHCADRSTVVGDRHIIEAESPILERGTVRKQARTHRVLNDDIHRNRVGDVAPFELVLAKHDVQAVDSQSRPRFRLIAQRSLSQS